MDSLRNSNTWVDDPDETQRISNKHIQQDCLPSVHADMVLLGVKPFSLQTRRNVFTRQLNQQLQGNSPDETGWQILQTTSTGNKLIATLAGKEINPVKFQRNLNQPLRFHQELPHLCYKGLPICLIPYNSFWNKENNPTSTKTENTCWAEPSLSNLVLVIGKETRSWQKVIFCLMCLTNILLNYLFTGASIENNETTGDSK